MAWVAATALPVTMLSGAALAQTSSPTDLSWTEKTPMPTARRDDGVAADSTGKIYVVGGYDGNGGFLTTLEEYDPTTDSWTTKKS